jgi:predicted glycoside hydrolase/deacetylase ChbG (UPF0249 family)
MARTRALSEAVEIACATPTLGVGCHVVLVDGEPVLSPRQDVPNLADPVGGCFRSSLAEFLYWAHYSFLRGRSGRGIAEKEIEIETAAQIALLQGQGVALTHIDTHKHVHIFPAVLRPILRAARAAGIHAIRNPFEPLWSLRATPNASWIRSAEVSLLRRLEPAFRRAAAEEGFATTDGAIGVLATGTLDSKAVISLLSSIPPGTWELVTHPGYNDGDLAEAGTRLRASREVEREALLALKGFPEIELVSFADLQGAATPVA